MEQPACPDQEPNVDNVKVEPVEQADLPLSNGFAEDDGRKETLKRKRSESDDGGKRSYSKSEDNGGNEIPAHHARRPPNGFLLFCKRHRDIVSAKNPNLENRGVTKLLGNWWRTLEEEEREKYKELARQNKEIFIANNPQFTWYKLPAPPLRTLVTRPSNRRPPKLEPGPITSAGPITPGKLADESQLGGLTSLLSSSTSPPSTPLNASPPSPNGTTSAPPKKRFLLQTRTKPSDSNNSSSESDEPTDNNKTSLKNTKKKYKKKKNCNSLKYKKNLKMKWNESFNNKSYLENDATDSDPVRKSENGSPNCTKQQLIEKIVDSSFVSQKPFQDFDIQRKLDYINTEHTYQKNASRIWQQKQKTVKKDEYVPLQIVTKVDGIEPNIISPNVNNNTIVLTETKKENGLNDISYSFNDNNNLIINYVDVNNQRKMDETNVQTNHDRMRTINLEDGYIPGMYAQLLREDCDNTKGLEDQKKPLKVAQDDVIPKNCDRDSNFEIILGKVSREIASMINDRGPDEYEEMAVPRFNVKSETDSDGSGWDKSEDASPPSSPGGGRRSKRSCKGQRYEQFIKDSVSKKRSKNPDLYEYRKNEIKMKKRKSDVINPSSDELDVGLMYNEEGKDKEEDESTALIKEECPNEDSVEQTKEEAETSSQSSEDLNIKQGVKASEIIQKKLEMESKLKKENDEKIGRRHSNFKNKMKKKPVSKVQMIKEKKELHVGEFNLNEKIEELPLLSFDSFLQKKRQRKKRLLGLKKESLKNKNFKNKLEKYKSRDPRSPKIAVSVSVPNKPAQQSGQSASKPDFADLTTLAETALTLLSLGEPR